MSIKLMTMVWDVEFPTQSQLLIALKMADFANDDGGSIYPSRSRVARNAQCSETTVKAVLRAFRAIGLLHVIKEGGKGPRNTTEYAYNVGLLECLVDGSCTIEGGAEELEIKWADKGAEFDPLTELRGRTEPVRGRNSASKGATSRPQPFTNCHLDELPLRAGARATQGAARPLEEEVPRLVMRDDTEWRLWMRWLASKGQEAAARMFETEGAMVVLGEPSILTPMPMLAPAHGSAKRAELEAARENVARAA